MQPTLPDDALLFFDFDHDDAEQHNRFNLGQDWSAASLKLCGSDCDLQLVNCSKKPAASTQQSSADAAAATATIQQLQDENMALRDTLQQMSTLGLPTELDRDFQVLLQCRSHAAMLVLLPLQAMF